jgi:acyl-CoA reductase-like NAD-dependent aldehyde dehydrogenase
MLGDPAALTQDRTTAMDDQTNKCIRSECPALIELKKRYVAPSVLDLGEKGLTKPSECALLAQEMFCPIMTVIPFDTPEEAITVIKEVRRVGGIKDSR